MTTARITATTIDVTAPTLICIGASWLRAIGVTDEQIDSIPGEIDHPSGGVIVTHLHNWGGGGNSGRDVRSLDAMPEPRRLVLVATYEGYGGPGSLGPVVQLAQLVDGQLPPSSLTEGAIAAVLAELARVPAAQRDVYEIILVAARGFLGRQAQAGA